VKFLNSAADKNARMAESGEVRIRSSIRNVYRNDACHALGKSVL
jgi:hypothetical protein